MYSVKADSSGNFSCILQVYMLWRVCKVTKSIRVCSSSMFKPDAKHMPIVLVGVKRPWENSQFFSSFQLFSAKKGKFSVEKWRFDKTDPHCSVVPLCRCPLMRECKQKKKIQFSFSKVSASAYKRVSAYGNVSIQSLTGKKKTGI